MKARLDQAAAKQAGLAQEIAKVEQLKHDTRKLLDQGFDKLTPAALDALLQQYDAINPDLRKELVQLVQDLKKQLAKLQSEVAAALAKFRTRMLAVDDLVKQAAKMAGAYGQELEKLEPLADFKESGDIDVPSILGTSGFDGSQNPYIDYADEVLDQLSSTVVNGKVVERETFLDIVGTWRLNQEALMSALLLKKDVCSAEYEAFLAAQKMVVTYLRSHMDEGYWFHDADVPQDVRAWLDSRAFKRFKQLAIDLKRALNLMPKLQGGERGRLHATLRGLMGMHRASVDYTVLLPTEGLAEIERAWRETVLRIRSFTTTVASMVPFLGAYIALCEFASGDEGCVDGVKLSTGQRALALASLLPFGKAIGHVASAAGGVAVKAGIKGKMIIAGIADLAVPARRALARRLRKLDPKAVDNLTKGMNGKQLVQILDTWTDCGAEAIGRNLKGDRVLVVDKQMGEAARGLFKRTDVDAAVLDSCAQQVDKALVSKKIDVDGLRSVVAEMKKTQAQQVVEYLAEVKHANNVVEAGELAQGGKLLMSAENKNGHLYDLGGGAKVSLDTVSEADAFYRGTDGMVHVDEVKHTAAALRNKWLTKGTGQAEAMVKWCKAGANRKVMYVVESEHKWTDLFRDTVKKKQDAFDYLRTLGVWLQIGKHRFSPQEVDKFYKLFAAKFNAYKATGMSPAQFYALPQLKTVSSAAQFIGYP